MEKEVEACVKAEVEGVHWIIICRFFFMGRSVDKPPLSPRTDCSAYRKGCWAVSH